MQHLRKPNHRLALSTLLLATSIAVVPAFAAVGPPTTPDMTDAYDSGFSHTDNITSVIQPTFSGKGIPLASIKLFAGGAQVGFGVVAPSGQWMVAINTKLKDGSYAISARQSYGGVESTSSYAVNIVVDTVAPAVPAAPNMAPHSDHGSSGTDDLTNTTTPTLQGSGKAGEFVELYNVTSFTPIAIGSTTIAANGQWSCPVTTPLASGTRYSQVAAKAHDAAGNTSALSAPLTIHIDTDRPAIANTPDLLSSDDSGISNTDNITNVALPTFTVNAEPENKVCLYTAGVEGTTLIGTAIANTNGLATIKATKPLTGNVVYAVNFDAAGNQAANSTASLVINIDTEAPPVPAKPALSAATDSGIAGDGITNVNKPVVGGTSADSKDVFAVSYYGPSPTPVALPVANVDETTHQWSATLPTLADGNYKVTVMASDKAGNHSESPILLLAIRTKAPSMPSMPDLIATDDTGISSTDNISNKNPLHFVGTSQPSLKIVLYNSGSQVAETTSDAQGKWNASLLSPFVKDVPLQITAKAFDAAGNASASSPQLSGILDSTNPYFSLTTPNVSCKNFNVLSGAALDTDPSANGAASGLVKTTMRINRASDNKSWSGSAWTSASTELPVAVVNGKWSMTTGLPLLGSNPLTQLQDGEYKITLSATDKAGNSTIKGNYISVDNASPTVAILEPAQNSSHTVLFVTGTASDNVGVAKVKVSLQHKFNNTVYYWNGSTYTTVPTAVDAVVTTVGEQNVTWTCSTPMPHDSDLVDGAYTLYAAAYDGTGNLKISSARSFSIEASPIDIAVQAKGSGGSS